MKTNIILEIPKPCHEDWDGMTLQDQGRFCNQCHKVVVDFSVMSDEEVLNYFNTTTGHTCGRVAVTQAVKPEIKPMGRRLKLFLYALAMIFVLNSSEPLFAQDTIAKKTLSEQTHNASLSGCITGEKNQVLDFATVQLLRKNVVVAICRTDMNGHYLLNGLKPGSYNLKIAYIGYKDTVTELIIVKGEQKLNINMTLKEKTKVKTYIIGFIREQESPGTQRLNREEIKHSGY